MSDVLAVETLAALVLVVIYLLTSVYLRKFSERIFFLRLIHESGLCILLGMLLSGMFIWTSSHTPSKFEASLFFQFMLPFLVFGVGYNMKRRRFFRNIGPIVLNGVAGTFINFTLLTTLFWVYGLGDLIPENISLKDALALGAVLSCPETVVSLSLVRETSNPRLNSIIFGESLIGNAISILLISAMQLADFNDFTASSFFVFVGVILYSLIGSFILGVTLGFISALMTKNITQIKLNPNKEVALQFYIAWTGYIIATMVGCSGVVTILICAIITSHYAYYNMTKESRIVVADTFQLFGDGSRALIFGYLGMTSLSYSPGDISGILLFLVLLAIMTTRFLTIFGLAFLMKIFKKSYRFDCKNLIVIWVGGLFRGTIAFALILSISLDQKDKIQVTVLYVIIVSMILYTLVFPLILYWLGPKEEIISNQSILEAVADGYYRNSYMKAGEANILLIDEYKSKRNWIHAKWRDIDNLYLKPCLIDNVALEELQDNKRKLEEAARPNSIKKPEIEIWSSNNSVID